MSPVNSMEANSIWSGDPPDPPRRRLSEAGLETGRETGTIAAYQDTMPPLGQEILIIKYDPSEQNAHEGILARKAVRADSATSVLYHSQQKNATRDAGDLFRATKESTETALANFL